LKRKDFSNALSFGAAPPGYAGGGTRGLISRRPIMEERLKTILAESRQYLSELYGNRLVDVALFGSQARGDVTEAKVNASDGSRKAWLIERVMIP
jgi:hypothetical protein